MNFTQDEIATIVGAKELELIALRREVALLQANLKSAQANGDATVEDRGNKITTLEIPARDRVGP